MSDGDDHPRRLGADELPCIVEAVRWMTGGMLEQMTDRDDRQRWVMFMQLAWNLDLVLRENEALGMKVLEQTLGDRADRDWWAENAFAAVEMKRARYADDPRRITKVRLVDGPQGEEIVVEWELFAGVTGELVPN